jgi:hypothetical protein
VNFNVSNMKQQLLFSMNQRKMAEIADIVIPVKYWPTPFGYVAQLPEDHALYCLRTII